MDDAVLYDLHRHSRTPMVTDKVRTMERSFGCPASSASFLLSIELQLLVHLEPARAAKARRKARSVCCRPGIQKATPRCSHSVGTMDCSTWVKGEREMEPRHWVYCGGTAHRNCPSVENGRFVTCLRDQAPAFSLFYTAESVESVQFVVCHRDRACAPSLFCAIWCRNAR